MKLHYRWPRYAQDSNNPQSLNHSPYHLNTQLIKQLQKKHGISARGLGLSWGIPDGTIGRTINDKHGHRNPFLQKKIARFFAKLSGGEVTVEQLLLAEEPQEDAGEDTAA